METETCSAFSGQLVGTLFSHDGARQVEIEQKKSQAKEQELKQKHSTDMAMVNGHAERAARDMAVAARSASRVLQSLSSKVRQACILLAVLFGP